MKKLLLFTFVFGVMFWISNLKAQDTLRIPGLPEAPVVDGEMDNMWDNIDWVEIDKGAPVSDDDSDFYTRMKIAWHGDHIYILVERVDDTLTYGPDAAPYHQDYVTLYIDADGYSGLSPSFDNAQVWWARSTYDGNGGFGGDGRTGDPDNEWVGYDYFAPVLTQAYTVDGASLLIEYSLETGFAGFTDDLSTEVGDEFGFEFEIGDTDDFEEGTDNRKYMHFINPDGNGGAWDDVTQYNVAIIDEIISDEPEEDDTIRVPGLAEAPTVDGEMEDMWNNIDWVEIDEGAPVSDDDSDFYTRMKIAWHGDHIYILVERVDDTLTYGPDAAPYHQDYVTLYIDADGYSGLSPSFDNAQVWWARSTYDGNGGFGGDGRTGDPDNEWVGYDYFAPVLTQAYTVDGASLLIEYSLETGFAGFTDDLSTDVGDEFGFEFEIGDTDVFEEGTDNRKYMHFTNPDGNGGAWDDVTQLSVAIIDDVKVGIDQSLANVNAKLFPNPAANSIQFSSDQVVDQISIYNVTGSKVLSKSVNCQKGQVNISGLKAGVYFVKLSMGNTSNVIKLLKK